MLQVGQYKWHVPNFPFLLPSTNTTYVNACEFVKNPPLHPTPLDSIPQTRDCRGCWFSTFHCPSIICLTERFTILVPDSELRIHKFKVAIPQFYFRTSNKCLAAVLSWIYRLHRLLHMVRPWSTKRLCGSRFCSSKRLMKGITGASASGAISRWSYLEHLHISYIIYHISYIIYHISNIIYTLHCILPKLPMPSLELKSGSWILSDN